MNDKILGVAAIRARLPWQPALLLLDRAVVKPQAQAARALRCVSANEPHFLGHFPGRPILPGVLQVESIFQLALLAAAECGIDLGKQPFLRRLAKVKFRRPVSPGERLEIAVNLEQTGNRQVTVTGSATAADAVSCEATMELGAGPADEVQPARVLLPADPELPRSEQPLNVNEVLQRIPHRYPFMLLDGVTYSEDDELGNGRIVAFKNVSAAETFAIAPELGVLPHTLLPEIAAQTGCALMFSHPANRDKAGLFMSIDEATFRRPVLAGDTVWVDLQLSTSRSRFGKADSTLYVGPDAVAEIAFKFAVMDG